MTDAPPKNELFGSPQAAALYSAAAKGDIERARQLLAQGVSLNSANTKEQTLLKVAMLKGDRKAFDNLLTLSADPAYLGGARDTPMHLAAVLEDPYWLKTLLARGTSTDVPNAMGETPLFRALNQPGNIRLLLDAGANIQARNRQAETLLHVAAAMGANAAVVQFLELGTDPRAINRIGVTFQPAFFMTRESLLNAQAKEARAKVRAWLRAHNIPVEDAGQR